MRLSLRAAGFVALAIVAITCTDAPTGPNKSQATVQTARLSMSPYFTPEAAKIYNSLALFGQEVTEIHIHLTAADGTQRDTVINFPAGQDSLVIEIPVPVSSNDQPFNAVIELRNDQHTVLFSGTQTVIARAANLPPLAPPAVHIDYTGPGKGTKTVSVLPLDATAAAGATTGFSATAVDSSGKPVTDLLVRWTTSDATLATIALTSNTTANVVGQGKRGQVTISAITPSGIVGTSHLTLVPPPARIVVISGGAQTGVAGSLLTQPLVVEVQATDNLPVPGASVTFRSISAGGSVTTASATTDASGRASTTMKLPNIAGSYQYEAASGALAVVTVSETATPAQPALIAIASGDGQIDSLGRVLPVALVAKVTDQFGGPVNAATVNWTKVSGAGSVGSASAVTGVDGLASTSYTLGNVVGPDTVRATVVGVSGTAGSVLFSMRAIARGPSGVTIISGGGQSGLPGAVLPTPIVAKVVDALNNPVTGANVTWTASNSGATFSPSSATTSATGQVSTTATLGGTSGPVTVTATSGALSGTTSLTVTTPPVVLPPTMTKTAGDGQSAIAGTAVVVKPTVVIKDGNGIPTQGVQVVFAVSGGGGTATGTTATTDVNGVATVGSWTLGTAAGTNTLTTTAGALSATFTASGTAGVANKLAFVQPLPTSIVVGAAIAPIKVRLTDANGNAVNQSETTITLTGAVTPNTNSNISGSSSTDGAGVATITLAPYNGTSGSVVFTATAPGTSALVSPSIPLTSGAATKLVIITQPQATIGSGAIFSPAIVVQVSDAGGNPISSATTITAAIATGGGSISGTVGVPTGGSSVANFTNLRMAGPVGPQTLVFSAPGLTSVTSNTTSIVAGGVSAMAKNAGDAQTATAGTSVAIAPSVLLTDVTGNPVPNVTVTFAVSSGGGAVTVATPTTNASGIATVGSWTLGNTAGPNTLTATAGTTSAVFTATGAVGTAAKLKPVGVFLTTFNVGAPLSPFQVQLADANGNAVAQAGVNVTLSTNLVPGNVTHTFTVATDAAGIATYPINQYDDPIGTLTLTFTAPGATAYVAPNITVLTGAAAKLIMKTQPSATAILGTPIPVQPAVQLTDIGNNPVATAGIPVTARIVFGGGALNGALIVNTDATGAATFTNLTFAGPLGTRALGFANVAYDSTVSNNIVMAVGPAQNLVITAGNGAQTAQVGANVATNPAIRVTDQFGNGVSGVNVTFTPRNGSRANGVLTPVTLTTPANGNLSVTWTLGNTAGFLVDSLDVSSGTLSGSPLLFTANATAGAAQFLVGAIAPNATQSGSVLSPSPAVRVVDGNFNPVAGVRSISVSITSGSPTLSGTTTLNTDATGLATFTDLVIAGAAGARTLSYTSAGLVTYNNTVTITAGAATKLGVSGSWNVPGPTQSGAAISPQPAIQILDANGNPVAVAGVVVTATVASGPSSPTPTLTSAAATTNASGIATFSGLALTGAAGSYTLTFSASGLTAVTPVTTLNITGGVATTIALNGGEGQSAQVGQVVPTAPTVKVTDASGNPVSGVNVTFTAVTPTSQVQIGVATATSLSTTTNASGIAQVSWILGTNAGAQTMTATSGTLSGSPVTFHATANSATATKMTLVSGVPSSVTVGAPNTTPVLVQITDSFGNAVTQAGVNIQGAATVLPSNQSFFGSATTNASGIASITLGTYSGQSGTATITFTSLGLSANTTASFPVVAGAATKLVVAAQPPNTVVSAATFTPQPTVQVTDVGGNAVAVSGQHIVASVTPSLNATLGGTVDVVTNASGLATFTNLAVTAPAAPASRQLIFTNGTFGTVNSSVFDVTTGAANTISANSATSLGNQPVGTVLTTLAPSVKVTDAAGSPVSGVSVTFLASGTGSTVNDGVTTATSIVVVTNASGVAKVTAWTLGATAQSYAIAATAVVPNGSPLTFTAQGQAGAATKIALTTIPSTNATSGIALNQQPVLQVQDANGNPVSQSGLTVTASITSGTGTLTNATATTIGNGSATFSGLRIDGTAGNFILRFSAGTFAPVASGTITVAAGTLNSITVTPNPVTVTAGGAQQFTAVGKDAQNNVVSISPSWSVVNGGGTINSASGIFAAGITAGTYANTVKAASGAVSGTATVTIPAGSPSQIVLATAPSTTASSNTAFATQPTIQVKDANGNPTPVSGLVVTVGILSGSGSVINSQATTDATGLATFSGLAINGVAGSFVLQFYIPGVATVNSSTITLTAGVATKLIVSTSPTASVASGVVFPTQPSIRLADANDNAVSQAGVTVAVAINISALNGTLTTTTNASGIASFTNLSITGTLGSRILTYSASGVAPTTSSVNVVAGAATKLVVGTAPSTTTTSGAALGQQPVIQLQDASGNAVSTAGVVVTATVFSGTGTLANATATTNAFGAATFTGLSISGTAGSFVLHFDAPSLTTVASGPITVSAGAVATVTVTPGSVSLANGTTQQFTATGTDANGNVVAITPTWSVIAGGGSITTTGLFTASGTIGTYTNTIKAVANAQPGLASVVLTNGVAANIQTVAGVQNAQPTGVDVPAGQIKFQVKDAGLNPVGAGTQVDYSVAAGPTQCAVGLSSVTAANGIATVAVTSGFTPGACVLTATIHGLTGPSATAKIVVAADGATLAWFGGDTGNANTYSDPFNWRRTDGSQANDAPNATSVPYVPYDPAGPYPAINSDWTVGGFVMDGGAVFNLGGRTLTTAGSILIVNPGEFLPQYSSGTVISTGHGVTVGGDFVYLTAGRVGCGGAVRDSVELITFSVTHTLTVNCATRIDNGVAGGIVGNAGSWLLTGSEGYVHVADSLKFMGDSLVIADASLLDVNSATIGGRLALRSNGALSSDGNVLFNGTGNNNGGTITVGGNVFFGGTGSAGYTFTSGTLNVYGNFTTYAGGTGTPFVAEGNHYTDFQGLNDQRINIAGGHHSGTTFGTLAIDNSGTGVTFETGMNMPTGVDAPRGITIGNGKLTLSVGDTLMLNSGSLLLDDSPSYFTINGALTLSGGCINFGTLTGSGTINGGSVPSYNCSHPGGGGDNRIPLRKGKPTPRTVKFLYGRPRTPVVASKLKN